MSDFKREVAQGERFEFGKNWQRFVDGLDDARITQAEASLRQMLDVESLADSSFLDAGSGSGLFSLAARRLGARVTSFDYDVNSVACTRQLKENYFPNDGDWKVLEGSVLDQGFLASLGQFDVVYSWGVLHHTGKMWSAIENVLPLVKPGGKLFIMIYADLGWKSKVWTAVKRTYCSGLLGRALVVGTFIPYYWLRGVAEDLLRLKNPAERYRQYYRNRGMSKYHDWIDWLGGYPYEYALPDQIIGFCSQRGFQIEKQVAAEYIFRRLSPTASSN